MIRTCFLQGSLKKDLAKEEPSVQKVENYSFTATYAIFFYQRLKLALNRPSQNHLQKK
jgi:hypothetical protein